MTTRRTVLRTALTAGGLTGLGTILVACGADAIDTSAPAPAGGGTAASSRGTALDPETRDLLTRHGIEAATAEDAVTALDQLPAPRPLEITGSVGYDQVLFADAATEAAVPLAGGQFYLSVAPYRTQTHDCYYHNLGGCQGELVETPVHVAVATDAGESLVEKDATTYANGFVGFWLPRDLAGTVTVTVDGETATSPFDSGPDGPTCLTTLQLA